MTQDELEKMKSDDIRKLASKYGITYASKKSKKELIEKILIASRETLLPDENQNDCEDQDTLEEIPPLEIEKEAATSPEPAANMISSEQLKLLEDEQKPNEVEATNKSADKQDVENKKEISPAPSIKEQVDVASSRQEAMNKLRSNSSSAKARKKKPTSDRKLDYFLLPISLLMLILLVSSFVTLAYEILWTGNKENDILSMSILILAFIILMKYVKASIKNGTARKVLNHYHAKIEKELEEKEENND